MIESIAKTTSVSGRLAIAVLEWLIGANKLDSDCDLCLVRVVPGLDPEPPPTEVVLSAGRRWRIATADGDFELRMKLVEAGGAPLLAFTNCDETHFSADLRERAALRYVIRPLARHVFGALIGSDASALDDDQFSQALRDVIDGGRRDRLVAAIRRRTLGSVVRESDATAILCEAAFGFDDRYVESRPGELLAGWLQDPPLQTPRLYGLAIGILRQRYPLYADLLESTPDRSPQTAFQRAARHDRAHEATFVRLARDAGRALLRSAPALLHSLLRESEAAYVAAGSPAIDAFLLRSAYLARARILARRAASDAAPSSDEIESLSAYLYFEPALRDSFVTLARLSRGLATLGSVENPATLAGDAHLYREQIAWLDRAARRVREAHFDDVEVGLVATQLVNRWYLLRDRLNLEFATKLANAWSTLFMKPGDGQPFVVSHILKHIVRPMLLAGTRVFLVVLDGCDVPTFLEIADALHGAGVPLPSLDVMLSAVPTMTSHARRAIFTGKIPKDWVSQAAAADDPAGDRQAFEGPNVFLEGFARRLFLKGDLGDDGAALVKSLESNGEPLIAAVFNDVDDAIASKEHGVLPERTIERCTMALRRAMIAASDAGWRIVLTADHGHTPYRSPDIKLSLAHARYSELGPKDVPPPGTVVIENGLGSPYRLAAAYQVGAHSGPQHVGYHGGVSLEEMFVPLAVYGAPRVGDLVLQAPSWWDDELPAPAVHVPAPVLLAASAPQVASSRDQGDIKERCRTALVADGRLLDIFERIAEARTLDAAQLGRAVGIPAGRVRISVAGLREKLEDAGIEVPFTMDEDPVVVRWTGSD